MAQLLYCRPRRILRLVRCRRRRRQRQRPCRCHYLLYLQARLVVVHQLVLQQVPHHHLRVITVLTVSAGLANAHVVTAVLPHELLAAWPVISTPYAMDVERVTLQVRCTLVGVVSIM